MPPLPLLALRLVRSDLRSKRVHGFTTLAQRRVKSGSATGTFGRALHHTLQSLSMPALFAAPARPLRSERFYREAQDRLRLSARAFFFLLWAQTPAGAPPWVALAAAKCLRKPMSLLQAGGAAADSRSLQRVEPVKAPAQL